MQRNDIFEIDGYRLTGEPELTDHNMHYGPELEKKMLDAYLLAQQAKPRSYDKLTKLVEKYPGIPAFKNYLMVYYANRGKSDKAEALNKRIVREHPDYLHGKLNLAARHIEREEYEEALKILGESLELKNLLPERKVFHLNEFGSYYEVTIQYLTATDRLNEARERLDLLEEVYPESPHINLLREEILHKVLEKRAAYQLKLREKRALRPIGKSYRRDIQTDEAPDLQHPELQILYERGLDIAPEKLKSLLSLPRPTLIEDLKTILWDSVCRFEYFNKKVEYEGWADDFLSFPLHAQFLLIELRAKEQLPFLLDCLRQGEEYLDFWYGDHIFETLWQFIYHLGQDQLELLQEFLREPDIQYQAKGVVVQAVTQIGLHQPERREEVLEWYRDIFSYLLDHLDEELLIDEEMISQLVGDLLNLPGCDSLLPSVSKLYELDLIDPSMAGDLDDITEEMARDEDRFEPMTLHANIFEHYNHITKNWYGYMSEEEQAARDELFRQKMEVREPQLPQRTSAKSNSTPAPVRAAGQAKVGRNDPCPCGSGKKYKKCCWGK